MRIRRPIARLSALSRDAAYLGVIFLLAALGTGCQSFQKATGHDTPSARITGVHLEGWDLISANFRCDIEVKNPYPTALPLVSLEYGIVSTGQQLLSGKLEGSRSLPPRKKTRIPVGAKVTFAEVLQLLTGVEPGSLIPYTADVKLSVDAPGVGIIEIPLRRDGELPVPAPPEVELGAIEWEGISFDKATAVMNLRIINKNQFPMDLSKLSYGLTLGSVRVMGASIDRAVAFPPGGENSIEIRSTFSPQSLGLAVFQMLLGTGASYKLGGTMSFDTLYGVLNLPYERSGQTVFKR